MNIMTLRNAAFGGLALLLAACGQGPEATGFITENLPPPEGAEIEEGDVPRDDAGRPFRMACWGKRFRHSLLPCRMVQRSPIRIFAVSG